MVLLIVLCIIVQRINTTLIFFKKIQLLNSCGMCHTELPIWEETALLKNQSLRFHSICPWVFQLWVHSERTIYFSPQNIFISMAALIFWQSCGFLSAYLFERHPQDNFAICLLACILSLLNIPLSVPKIYLLCCHTVTDKEEINFSLTNFILSTSRNVSFLKLHFKYPFMRYI